MTFAERLKDLMVNNNITPYKLSKETGITQATISRWRNSKAVPDGNSLAKLSEFFDVSIDYLIGDDGSNDTATLEEENGNDDLSTFNFAERLTHLIEERKTTAYKVAKDTGISIQNIGVWKSGKSVPSLDKLTKLADYFEVSIDYLVGRTNHEGMYEHSFVSNGASYVLTTKSDQPPDAAERERLKNLVSSSVDVRNANQLFSDPAQKEAFEAFVRRIVAEMLENEKNTDGR